MCECVVSGVDRDVPLFQQGSLWRSHMLVLILVWLLAGVSSPWLPSLGGDWGGREIINDDVMSLVRTLIHFSPALILMSLTLILFLWFSALKVSGHQTWHRSRTLESLWQKSLSFSTPSSDWTIPLKTKLMGVVLSFSHLSLLMDWSKVKENLNWGSGCVSMWAHQTRWDKDL